ncbi:MAG: DHH family phosphoesterase [Candidatus Bathyarchaeota archaeon]|nr:MAG: DHH family phosphoesterase [Candidatus Bathyarchaeota archaeon]
MPIRKAQITSFLASTSDAAEVIRKSVDKDEVIHVVSHLDADGLSAAGIIGKSLYRLNGTFRIQIERWIDERLVNEIANEQPPLTIFTDLGSGYLDLLNEKLSDRRLLILDHHQPVGEASSTFTQVNPHLHGIDGSCDLSGAGVAYLVAKAIDRENVDLAPNAVVGALGDLQDKYAQRKLGGLNEVVVDDAVKAGDLELEIDLLLFGRETRPIHKALTYITNPFIPGISGEEDRCYAFLNDLGIKVKTKDERWRTLKNLSEDEKKKLFSALAEHLASKNFPNEVALGLIGNVYTLTREEPWTPLRNAREFTVLLNATGRLGKAGLGVAICIGDRGVALERANNVLKDYRRTITDCLSWLAKHPDRTEELSSIHVVRGGGPINDKMIGALSSILSTGSSSPEKPIIAYSKVTGEDMVKISARTRPLLSAKSLDLGAALRIAAEKYSGRGGGHNVAAGAHVPVRNLESFIEYVNKLIKKQLDET